MLVAEMTPHFRPMTEVAAREILGWRYPAPYSIYTSTDGSAVLEMLDPGNPSYGAYDDAEVLLGFCCFRGAAQVPAGWEAGVYADTAALDIGLGLRPDLTGKRQGLPFVCAVLELARSLATATSYRFTVAAFNARAITVYERAGFRITDHFTSNACEFLTMVRIADQTLQYNNT